MFKNVHAECVMNRIRLSWEWDNPELTGVTIYYKKKEASTVPGTMFIDAGNIARIPGSAFGTVERIYKGESGLYTFTFVGVEGDRVLPGIIIEDVMLGPTVPVTWKLEACRDGYAISFPECGKEVPADILRIEYQGYGKTLNYPINIRTKLYIPCNIPDIEQYRIYVKEPYDKVYKLKRLY